MNDPCVQCEKYEVRNYFLRQNQYLLAEILAESVHTPSDTITPDLMPIQDRFRILSEITFEAVAVHIDGKILDVNQRYIELFGYTRQEFEHLTGLDMIAPESRETVSKHTASGYEEPYQAMGLKKNGTVFPIEIRAKKSQFDGQTVRIGAIKDLSHERTMEQQYKLLYKNAQAALYRTRIHDGKLLMCSRATADLLGFADEDELRAQYSITDSYVNLSDRTKLIGILCQNKRVEGYEVQLTRKDGSPIWVVISAEIFQEQGYIEGVLVDITTMKLLTQTEKKILDMVMQGMGNRQIASTMERSIRTVEDHRSNLMKKLDVGNIVELTQKVSNLINHKQTNIEA